MEIPIFAKDAKCLVFVLNLISVTNDLYHVLSFFLSTQFFAFGPCMARNFINIHASHLLFLFLKQPSILNCLQKYAHIFQEHFRFAKMKSLGIRRLRMCIINILCRVFHKFSKFIRIFAIVCEGYYQYFVA